MWCQYAHGNRYRLPIWLMPRYRTIYGSTGNLPSIILLNEVDSLPPSAAINWQGRGSHEPFPYPCGILTGLFSCSLVGLVQATTATGSLYIQWSYHVRRFPRSPAQPLALIISPTPHDVPCVPWERGAIEKFCFRCLWILPPNSHSCFSFCQVLPRESGPGMPFCVWRLPRSHCSLSRSFCPSCDTSERYP